MGKLRKRLAQATELPESSFGFCPYLTLESNSTVKIDECLEILSYDENEVRVRLRGMTVSVSGKCLTMRSYAVKTIRIGGKIENIAISDEL